MWILVNMKFWKILKRKSLTISTFILYLTIFLFIGCTNKSLLQIDEVQKFTNYRFNQKSTLISRVNNAPDFVLKYLIELDNKPEYKNYALNNKEYQIIKDNIELLPKDYKDELQNSLIGIYFIDNFWGSGLTHFVIDDNNNIYTIIIINPKLLQMNLSEALTWKERTCFIDDINYKLEIEVSDQLSGLLYILLHETTHAIDYTNRITPYPHPHLLKYTNVPKKSYDLFNIWEKYNKISKQYNSNLFSTITFYTFNNGPKAKYSDAINIYKELEKTPFVSLYSTLSWAEDIADLYTIQYLVEELGCDYTIKIIEQDNIIYEKNLYGRSLINERRENNTIF